ncbi:hypothetical protein LTR27_011278 [Elasticomyces elasticus]|nr:hypothetical protein LTR27_011278 [Elasticomyces elasticus]
MATESALLDQQFSTLTNLLHFLVEKGWLEIPTPANQAQDDERRLDRALRQATTLLARNNSEIVTLTSAGDIAVTWRTSPGQHTEINAPASVPAKKRDTCGTLWDMLYTFITGHEDGDPLTTDNAPLFARHADAVRRLLKKFEPSSRLGTSWFGVYMLAGGYHIVSSLETYCAKLGVATRNVTTLQSSTCSVWSKTMSWTLDGKRFGHAQYLTFLSECQDQLMKITDLHGTLKECIVTHRQSSKHDCAQPECNHEQMLWDTVQDMVAAAHELNLLVDGRGDTEQIEKRHRALLYFMANAVPANPQPITLEEADEGDLENESDDDTEDHLPESKFGHERARTTFDALHTCSLHALRRLVGKCTDPDYERLTKRLKVVLPEETVVDLLAPAALFTWLETKTYSHFVRQALAALQVLAESGQADYADLATTTALCEVHCEAFVVARACYPQSRTNHRLEFGLSQPCCLPCELILVEAFEDVGRGSPFRPRSAEVWRASFPKNLSDRVKRRVVKLLCEVLFDGLKCSAIIAAAEQEGFELPTREDSEDDTSPLPSMDDSDEETLYDDDDFAVAEQAEIGLPSIEISEDDTLDLDGSDVEDDATFARVYTRLRGHRRT